MKKEFYFKRLFLWLLLLLPVVYIGFGWWIGLNYGCKSTVFGPYPDIPVVVKTGLLGLSLEDISGVKAIMMVAPLRYRASDRDSSCFKINGYFEFPGRWIFDFAPDKNNPVLKKRFILTGSHSRAICHNVKNPARSLGSLSIEDFNDFLMHSGRYRDAQKLRPYLALAKLEEKFPYLYSETILVSHAMGNIFNDNGLPYDVLGLFGIVILFIALSTRIFYLWLYYLYWVASYWFGRIGYHDPMLIFTREGWQVILWSFWHGFILKEGRMFLVIAVGLSVITFGISAIVLISKQIISSLQEKEYPCECRIYHV